METYVLTTPFMWAPLMVRFKEYTLNEEKILDSYLSWQQLPLICELFIS